jgi:hypothetical protein
LTTTTTTGLSKGLARKALEVRNRVSHQCLPRYVHDLECLAKLADAIGKEHCSIGKTGLYYPPDKTHHFYKLKKISLIFLSYKMMCPILGVM